VGLGKNEADNGPLSASTGLEGQIPVEESPKQKGREWNPAPLVG
jgi:hypothetical protein